MLGVEVAPENQSHANTTLPGLIKLIDRLPLEKRPNLERGDAGAGGEPTMDALEARAIAHLFKLRLTKNIKRCQFTAVTVALAYNWWSLFVRLAHPKARLEALTSRPLLLSGIGQLTTHAGQTHLALTAMHGKAAKAKALLTRVSEQLNAWKIAAEQLNCETVWHRVCAYITAAVTGGKLVCNTKNLHFVALHHRAIGVFRFNHAFHVAHVVHDGPASIRSSAGNAGPAPGQASAPARSTTVAFHDQALGERDQSIQDEPDHAKDQDRGQDQRRLQS